MKKIITLLTVVLAFGQTSFGQTVPNKSQVEKDILSKTGQIEKQMKSLGALSGFENTKLEYSKGPLTKYSYASKYNYYSYFTKPDMVYYVYKLTTPTYSNGDKFVFNIVISYDSYKYESSGYRQPYNKYVIHSVNVNIDSYKGKELTHALLLDVLNDLSVEDGKVFKADKYQFVKIDSIKFTKVGEDNISGLASYNYLVDIYGVGVDYMYAGVNVIEYEVESIADVRAVFKTDVYMSGGKWKMSKYHFKLLFDKCEFTNVKEDKNTPAYKTINQLDLKTTMGGFTIENDIPKTTYRAYNDLKRMLLVNLEREPKESFLKGDIITHLFSTEHGKAVIDMFYGFKRTMKDYHLEKTGFVCSNYASIIGKEGESDEIRLSYRVKRKLTKEELKLAKKDPETSKEAKKNIQYRADGYIKFVFEVSLIDNKFIITNHNEARNNINFYWSNGSDSQHFLYDK